MTAQSTTVYANAAQPEIKVRVFPDFVSLRFYWDGSAITIFMDSLADARALSEGLRLRVLAASEGLEGTDEPAEVRC